MEVHHFASALEKALLLHLQNIFPTPMRAQPRSHLFLSFSGSMLFSHDRHVIHCAYFAVFVVLQRTLR